MRLGTFCYSVVIVVVALVGASAGRAWAGPVGLPRYRVTDLGTLPGGSYSEDSDAFRTAPGGRITADSDLGTLPRTSFSQAKGINDAGQVLGNAYNQRRFPRLPRRSSRAAAGPERSDPPRQRLGAGTCRGHQQQGADRGDLPAQRRVGVARVSAHTDPVAARGVWRVTLAAAAVWQGLRRRMACGR
jgi:hypothetical protein